MLPFLAKKNESASPGITIKTRRPDEKPESDENDPSAAREACGQAIIDAVKSDSATAVADAMQDMYDMCQSSASDETGEGPHTFEEQNIKAGQE